MPANVQTMAYYGEVPWHGLGNQIPKGVTAEQMIKAAGLDWKAELRPAKGAAKINKKGEYSRYEVIRLPRPNISESEVLFGVVSRRYQPLQNTEAFAFFDPIIGESKAFFETAGALGDGERVWVMVQMPGAMQIVPGDECHKYLLLSNSHTGNGSVIVKFTSIRVVCQNTLMLAMKDGQKTYSIRHSKQMSVKLEELSTFIAMAQEVFLGAETLFKRLSQIQLTGHRIEEFFEEVFPRSAAQKKKGEKPRRWEYLRKAVDTQKDLQLPGVRGTLWAAYNAITWHEDYKQSQQEEQQDQRLERTWFGGGADIKLKALAKAEYLAEQWS